MAKRPTEFPLYFWRGNSEAFEFRLKDKDGNAFDLTDYDVQMTVNHDGGTLKKKVSDNSISCADKTTGIISVKFTSTETRALSATKSPAGWELELSNEATGYQKTLLYGKVTVEGGINDD